MQNIPCEVLAYLRFSIFFLQFRHLKHVAQKAWSPVRMARSSILLLQTLQLYVQLLQIREPSPSRRRFASESRMVPQVLQRKQSMCHRLPAGRLSVYRSRKVTIVASETHQVRRPFLPRVSKRRLQSSALESRLGGGSAEAAGRRATYLPTTFTRICHLVLLHGRLCRGRVHHHHDQRHWVARTQLDCGNRQQTSGQRIDRTFDPPH